MTVNEMIKKYDIKLHGNDQLQVAIPKGLSKAQVNALKSDLVAAKPAILTELIARRDAEIKAREDAAAMLVANVPGLEILRDARSKWEMYHEAFSRAIDRGDVRMPQRPVEDMDAIKAQYPAAVAYLKAESYEYASHYAKSAAGRKAKQAIADGDNHIEALVQMEKEWSDHCNEHIWD